MNERDYINELEEENMQLIMKVAILSVSDKDHIINSLQDCINRQNKEIRQLTTKYHNALDVNDELKIKLLEKTDNGF